MKRASNWRRSAGFTLLEALLATLLMAFVIGALATLTAQWLPNWNRGINRLQRIELLAVGLDRLVGDLAGAQFVYAGATTDRPLFDGDQVSVTFIRTTLGPNASTGLEVVQIAETRDERGLALVRRTAPFLPLSGLAPRDLVFGNPVVIVRAPYRVSFSYAGPDRVWHENWRGAATIPRAIRVTIRDAGTSKILAASTSTLVNAELPALCTSVKRAADCPGLDFLLRASTGDGMRGR